MQVWRPPPAPVARRSMRRWRRAAFQALFRPRPVVTAGWCVRCGQPFALKAGAYLTKGFGMTCSPTCKRGMQTRRRDPELRRWKRYEQAVTDGLDPLERVVALAWLAARSDMRVWQLVIAVRACLGKIRYSRCEAADAVTRMQWQQRPDTATLTVYGCTLCGGYHVGNSTDGARPDLEAIGNRFVALLADTGRLGELASLMRAAPRASRAELLWQFTRAEERAVPWRAGEVTPGVAGAVRR